MKRWIAFWSILKKDIQNYYLKPPNISWGIMFPISWTLMRFIQSSGEMDARGFLPGLMAMSVLFGTMSMLAVTITFERKGRSFDRLMLAPISLDLLVLAKTVGAIIFGMANAFIPIALAAFFIDMSGIAWESVIAAVLMIAITSTLLALLIATTAKEVFEAQTYANFFRFPMLYLCGLFFPIANLPVFLRPLSYCLPLTYGTDVLNGAISGTNVFSSWLSFAFLLLFTAILYCWCRRNIDRKWIL